MLIELFVDFRVDADGDLLGYLGALGQRLSGVLFHLNVEELAAKGTTMHPEASSAPINPTESTERLRCAAIIHETTASLPLTSDDPETTARAFAPLPGRPNYFRPRRPDRQRKQSSCPTTCRSNLPFLFRPSTDATDVRHRSRRRRRLRRRILVADATTTTSYRTRRRPLSHPISLSLSRSSSSWTRLGRAAECAADARVGATVLISMTTTTAKCTCALRTERTKGRADLRLDRARDQSGESGARQSPTTADWPFFGWRDATELNGLRQGRSTLCLLRPPSKVPNLRLGTDGLLSGATVRRSPSYRSPLGRQRPASSRGYASASQAIDGARFADGRSGH